MKVAFKEISSLPALSKGKDLQSFNVVLIWGLGANFTSPKKFVKLIEKKALDYYEGIVQHLSNWIPKAPKVIEEEK